MEVEVGTGVGVGRRIEGRGGMCYQTGAREGSKGPEESNLGSRDLGAWTVEGENGE